MSSVSKAEDRSQTSTPVIRPSSESKGVTIAKNKEMVQLCGHHIYDAHTMPYDAVKLGKNPALPGLSKCTF